jgi:hypothetical protein
MFRRLVMSEPSWIYGDDVARGIESICDSCDERHDPDMSCVYDDPDVLHDEMYV